MPADFYSTLDSGAEQTERASKFIANKLWQEEEVDCEVNLPALKDGACKPWRTHAGEPAGHLRGILASRGLWSSKRVRKETVSCSGVVWRAKIKIRSFRISAFGVGGRHD